MSDASERLEQVRAAIARAARLAGREPKEVTLIAVSKTHPPESIEALIAAGQRDFGENRVQEAQAKWPPLRARHPGLRLHLVGRLQSNKARRAARAFAVIHSVDSVELLRRLDSAAAEGATLLRIGTALFGPRG